MIFEINLLFLIELSTADLGYLKIIVSVVLSKE